MPPIPQHLLGRRALTGCYPFRGHRTVAEIDAGYPISPPAGEPSSLHPAQTGAGAATFPGRTGAAEESAEAA